jgi:hypothetical protein
VAPNAAGSSSAVAAPPQIQSRRKKAIERSHISVGTNGSFCLADSLQDWWLRPPELRHYSRFEVGYPFQDGHPQVGSHLLTRCECQALPVFLGLNLTQPQKSAEAHAFELLLMLKPGVHCQGPDGPSMRQQLLDGCATFAEAKDKLMKEISQADPQSLQAQISRNFMSMLNMHDEAEKAKQKRDNEAREALQREGSREEIPQEEGVGEDSDTGKQPDVAEQAELERIRQLLAVEEEHNPTSMEEEEKAVSSARVRIVQGLEAFQRAGGLQGLEHSPTVTGQPQPQPQPQPQVPGSSSLPRGFLQEATEADFQALEKVKLTINSLGGVADGDEEAIADARAAEMLLQEEREAPPARTLQEEGVALNPKQTEAAYWAGKLAVSRAENPQLPGRILIITGPALCFFYHTTGKSTVIKAIKEKYKEIGQTLRVTASTNSAAALIGGMTLHSLMGIVPQKPRTGTADLSATALEKLRTRLSGVSCVLYLGQPSTRWGLSCWRGYVA